MLTPACALAEATGPSAAANDGRDADAGGRQQPGRPRVHGRLLAQRRGERYFEEIYTRPTANLMLGLSVSVRDGRAVGHELTRVVAEDGKVVMTPYPEGERSPHGFVLTSLRVDEATFEAPEHDYPKRIHYRRNADGSRWARIDGGPDDREGQEWRFVAAPCPGEAGPRGPLAKA